MTLLPASGIPASISSSTKASAIGRPDPHPRSNSSEKQDRTSSPPACTLAQPPFRLAAPDADRLPDRRDRRIAVDPELPVASVRCTQVEIGRIYSGVSGG